VARRACSRPNLELIAALQRAEEFGAKWLKVSLGYFTDNNDLQALAPTLSASARYSCWWKTTRLCTAVASNRSSAFSTEVEQHDLPIKMTFDIGNWQWQDQSAAAAARLLGRHVGYVHCKAVSRRADGKLVAVPPAATDLHLWEQLLRHMAQGVMRAAEYPLQGEDLVALTTEHVATLAHLGQSRLESCPCLRSIFCRSAKPWRCLSPNRPAIWPVSEQFHKRIAGADSNVAIGLSRLGLKVEVAEPGRRRLAGTLRR
jgi:hypothetical protein